MFAAGLIQAKSYEILYSNISILVFCIIVSLFVGTAGSFSPETYYESLLILNHQNKICRTEEKKGKEMASLKFLKRSILFTAALAMAALVACGTFLSVQGKPVDIGVKAPSFELTDHQGKIVSLEGLINKGPVLVLFYRGHW